VFQRWKHLGEPRVCYQAPLSHWKETPAQPQKADSAMLGGPMGVVPVCRTYPTNNDVSSHVLVRQIARFFASQPALKRVDFTQCGSVALCGVSKIADKVGAAGDGELGIVSEDQEKASGWGTTSFPRLNEVVSFGGLCCLRCRPEVPAMITSLLEVV